MQADRNCEIKAANMTKVIHRVAYHFCRHCTCRYLVSPLQSHGATRGSWIEVFQRKRLEEISTSHALQRKIDESDEEEKENRIKIHDDIVDLGTIDNLEDDKDVLLLDVQELPRII